MNLEKPLLVVIDTNVWISGIIWKGNPYDVITLVNTQKIIAVFSYVTFDEFEDTLNRKALFVGKIDIARVAIQDAKKLAVFLEPKTEFRKSRDPHDDMFLDICIISAADYLITGDEDLLSLKTIESTKIVTPKQFLTRYHSNKK
jgi:uncharacterized protein